MTHQELHQFFSWLERNEPKNNQLFSPCRSTSAELSYGQLSVFLTPMPLSIRPGNKTSVYSIGSNWLASWHFGDYLSKWMQLT